METALKLVAKEDEVNQEVMDINSQAKALKIIDSQSYITAGNLWRAIKELRKKVDDTFSPIISAAFQAHKTAVAKKKEVDIPLEEAERRVKSAMSNYEAEEELKRLAEQRRLEEIVRKEEENRRLQEAIEAEKAGDHAEAEAIINEPVQVNTVVLPKTAFVPKISGGPSFREVWSAEVIDIKLLCRAVADGKASPECVMGNMPVLNKMAMALKQTMNIPGVKAISRRV